MNFSIFKQHETRKFNYKPQFYTPEEEKKQPSQGYNSEEFAQRLHRSWSGRRQKKEKMPFPFKLVILMAFFAFIVGYVYFKFFMK